MRPSICKLSLGLGAFLFAALLGGQTQWRRPAQARLDPANSESTTPGATPSTERGESTIRRPLAGLTAQAVTAGPNLTVDAAASRHAISPDVYGINSYLATTSMIYDLRLPVTRWGGDATSEYNWKTDKTNSGSDWYFEVFAQTSATQVPPFDPATQNGSAFDRFHEANIERGAKSLGTIPIMDWVAGDFPDKTCNFSVKKYGSQQSVDPYHSDCGNGQVVVGKNSDGSDKTEAITSLKTTFPTDTDVQVDENFMADWVRHVTGKYGAAAQGGVAIWELDNEPVWWSGVHQGVHPASSTFDEVTSRGLRYAAAVKSADPTAAVAGPITAGWSDLFFSNRDLVAGWSTAASSTVAEGWKYWNNPIDRKANGDLDFVAYYLQQFAQYDQAHGQRLLDYFDVHGYMPGTSLSGDDDATNAKRLQSIRVFWDPNFILYGNSMFNGDSDEYLLNANPEWNKTPQCVCLIPRMKQWVASNYPGTKTSITEYILGDEDKLNGGLAQADLLGVFGREGLDLATLWGSKTIQPTYPVAFAFKMYRNYDGQGSAFGETSVSAVSSNQDQLAIYAAQRSDSALTLMVINKTANELSSNIALNNFQPDGTVQVWQYSAANLGAIVRLPDQSATASGVGANFPAYSTTLLIIPEAASALAPKPVISTIVNAASNLAAIAPGTMVKITGTNLGPASGAVSPFPGTSGFVNADLSNVRVLFNGAPAPVLSASAGAVLAIVPYSAAQSPATTVQVEYLGSRSDAFPAQLSASAPGVFTADGTGQGPALAFSYDAGLSLLALNSTLNPAAAGASLLFYMTGAGVLDPPAVDGRIEGSILPSPAQTVSVTIGGQPATVKTASAPGSVSGILLVNVTVPAGLSKGTAPLVVTIGGSSSQSGVTLAIE